MRQFAGKALRISLLCALLIALFTVSALAADLATGVGSVTGSSLNLRSEPTTAAPILTTLSKNTAVAILGETDGWYKISYAGDTGYVSADYIIKDSDGVFRTYGILPDNGVYIRAAGNMDGEVVIGLKKGDLLTVTGFQEGWYSVSFKEYTGFVRSDLLDLIETPNDSLADKLVSNAKTHLGTPYVYGGSCSSGFDCSGFTSYLYKQIGYSLPRTASGQLNGCGTRVSRSELQPGDLVLFRDPSRAKGKSASHVGLYIGDSQFIHASSGSGHCVKISSLNENYYSGYFVAGKHII